MFPHQMTVYRQSGSGFERFTVSGVLWDEIRGISISKTGKVSEDSVRVYIPSAALAARQILKGDKLVRGIQSYMPQSKISELMERFAVFTVTSIDNKDFGGAMSHKEVLAR